MTLCFKILKNVCFKLAIAVTLIVSGFLIVKTNIHTITGTNGEKAEHLKNSEDVGLNSRFNRKFAIATDNVTGALHSNDACSNATEKKKIHREAETKSISTQFFKVKEHWPDFFL